MKLVSRLLEALPHGIVAALALGLLAHGAWAQAPAEAPAGMEATLKSMLSAVQAGSVAEFVASGDESFKAGMNQGMFGQMRAQLAPRLAQGYTATFLGTLNQRGVVVYLWKLRFKDGKDDRLVTMAVNAGKVVGFAMQ